jgi:hypothetical protein
MKRASVARAIMRRVAVVELASEHSKDLLALIAFSKVFQFFLFELKLHLCLVYLRKVKQPLWRDVLHPSISRILRHCVG